MKSGLLAAAAGLLLLPVLVIAAAAGTLGVSGAGSSPTALATADIPPVYLNLYQAAGERYDLPWEVLAGIGKVECDHGRAPHPACREQGAENYAGAGGPMQFLAATWAAYGVDGDGDRRANRWNPADAIAGAARYLRASGAPRDMRRALYAYNHSDAYVDAVLGWPTGIANSQVPSPTASPKGTPPSCGRPYSATPGSRCVRKRRSTYAPVESTPGFSSRCSRSLATSHSPVSGRCVPATPSTSRGPGGHRTMPSGARST